MPERLSLAQRIKLQHIAEREVMRFAGDHALWHKHVHNVTLDSMQVLKCLEMDEHANSLDFSCRRTGKTAIKELYFLRFLAITRDQELGIVAPREAQSLVNLTYHTEAVRRSEILTNWLNYKSGRVQMADTYYQFANRSIARCYGIMAQVDGGDLTAASLEEVDDMPKDRLFSRFLLMMGSTRRLGASKGAENKPQIRITGVFKGADTLSDLVDGGHYRVLPTIDVYLGMEMGILNEQFMLQMRSQLSPDEYIRQLLCRNISARNLIWEIYVRKALQAGVASNLQWAAPLPGERYRRRGLISLGYDAGGHGEQAHSSKHAVVIAEQMGSWITFPFIKTWPPGADDAVVRRDLVGIWDYFRPNFGIGDAYGIGTLTNVNDDLFRLGLTHIDRRAVGDGSSTASTWGEWPFSPLRFEGMTKHAMASAMRALFHAGQCAIAYLDDQTPDDPETADQRLFIRQLTNIKTVATKASYPSYKMVNDKVGDDCFDAGMAAVWGLVAGAMGEAPVVVLANKVKRQQLLEASV